MPSPIGIRVPLMGSCCTKCVYKARLDIRCVNADYIRARYRGKVSGEDRFIDGETGQVVTNPDAFCCNYFDWTRP